MKIKLPSFVLSLFLLPLFFIFFSSSVFAANPGDVVINELMWMGTLASSADEWIELYNTTDFDIDLGGWTLNAEDGTPSINLSGTINANGYFLLERTDDNTISDIAANQIYTGALKNAGENLELLDATSNSIDTVDTDSGWFAGDDSNKISMERIDPGISGDEFSNWCSNNETLINGQDANGDAIFGTPKTQNSCYLITPTPISTPTPTPSLTPTPTPTLTPIPTPQITPVISFSPPSEVQVDQGFSLSVNLSNTDANSSYYLKALIGETNDSSEMREGKTKSEDGQSWLAWNGAWSKMPILQTNANGAGERVIEIKTDDDIVAGTYFLVIRIRKVETSINFDSEAKSFNVTALESEEPANAEDAENSQDYPGQIQDSPETTVFIAEAREMEDGEIVMIEGVVTAEPELLGSRTMYVEDESGGIKILLDEKNRDDIKLGNLIKITGELGESFNERYIKIISIEFLGQGDLPDALLVETGGIGEEYEGELIVVNGQVTETSGSVFYLDDGSGEVKVYIKSQTGIEKPKMRVGYYSEIRGICSQYNDYYRILPRYQDDLVVSQNPIEQGSILGSVATLPETGFHYNDFGLVILGAGLILRRLLK